MNLGERGEHCGLVANVLNPDKEATRGNDKDKEITGKGNIAFEKRQDCGIRGPRFESFLAW